MSGQKNKSNQLIKNIIRTALCRLILIGFGLYFTVYSSCINQNLNILAFLSCSLIVLIDTIYICVINKGIDHKWFSPSYSMYLVQIISLNWLGSTVNYELDDVSCETNLTVISNELNHKCGGSVQFINSCIYQSFFMCLCLCVMLYSRRFTPTKMNDGSHAMLMISYISASADLLDLYQYSQSKEIVKLFGSCGIHILNVLVLKSAIQMMFNLSSKKEIDYKNKGLKGFTDFFFGTETWSQTLAMLTLDIPNLITRIYILTNTGLQADPTFFFIFKNICMIFQEKRLIQHYHKEFKEKKSKVNLARDNFLYII